MKPEVWGPDFWLGALDFILRAFSTHWESLLGKLLGKFTRNIRKARGKTKKKKRKKVLTYFLLEKVKGKMGQIWKVNLEDYDIFPESLLGDQSGY